MVDLPIWFDHGLGDCVHFVHMLELCKQEGYQPIVHYEQNKKAVWEAAGIPYRNLDGSPYHGFAYAPGFNQPTTEPEWAGSKVAACFVPPLPDLGPIADVWERLCAVDLSDRLYSQITQEDSDGAVKFLADLPRPIILLHTCGSNFAEQKSIPEATTSDLYRLLLDGCDGSLVLLDWDMRVPMLPHARVRHIKQDWGHLSISQLAAVYCEASLLIGIDSGPYHLAAMTDLPAIGVFTHHYPSCVALPRSRSAVMVRNGQDYRPINRARRARWSVLEYSGSTPDAAAIASHALRMLTGPRYLCDRSRIGRDVMLQQWVRDWLRQSTGLSPRADRDVTMDWLLSETTTRFESPQIVETGCTRQHEDWSAGYSTYVWGAYLDGLGAGHLDTVDLDATHLSTAREVCLPWSACITYHASDSTTWLAARREPIDVLYLDSLDEGHSGHAEHCLAEVQAALPTLHERSLIAIDDTVWSGGWKGKGALAVPYMLSHGWRLAASGYQCVLERASA